MTIFWRQIAIARRIAFAAILFVSVFSLFVSVEYEKGTYGRPPFGRITSANGSFEYISQDKNHFLRKMRWDRQIDRIPTDPFDQSPGNPPFRWETLGFWYFHQKMPIGFMPSDSTIGFAIPYWAVLLVLALFEFPDWLRRMRERAVKIATNDSTSHNATLVEENLPCVHCGYNLRTMLTSARCPECGALAIDTAELNADLSKSRPAWLRTLAIANILLLLSRVFLLLIYATLIFAESNGDTHAGIFLLIAAIFYVIGIFLLGRSEHPYLKSHDQKHARRLRWFAMASLICFMAGGIYQTYLYEIFRRQGVWAGGRFDGELPVIVLLTSGWLIYCVCVVLESRFLAALAGRVLDRFMTEHCRIAGIGSAISGLIIVCFVLSAISNVHYDLNNVISFTILLCVFVSWMLFAIWIAFMNAYCVRQFLRQSLVAAQRWRARSLEVENAQ